MNEQRSNSLLGHHLPSLSRFAPSRWTSKMPISCIFLLLVAALLMSACAAPSAPAGAPATAVPATVAPSTALPTTAAPATGVPAAGAPTTTAPITSTTTAANDTRAGGQLVYGRSGDPASLDPGELASNEDIAVDGQMYETLVKIVFDQGKMSIEPGLAERWETTDGKEWTFHLRQGVKFHDGTDFNAQAVVFAFERQNDPKHPNFPKKQKFWGYIFGDIIEKVEAVDDFTVRFTLRDAFSPFISNVGQVLTGIPSPTAVQKYGDDFGLHPVGTGPFKFVEWVSGDRVVVERFDDYWGKPALLDRVIFRSIPDANARFNEVQAGSIDIASSVDPDKYEVAKTLPDIKLVALDPLNVGFLYMNIAHEPFGNLKVRQAVAHAIDKKAIVDAFYSGYGIPAKNILPPASLGYNNDIPDYSFDPALARQLLTEAGFPNGFDTTLWVYPPAGAGVGWTKPKEQGEAIQAYLAAVGIRAKIVTWEWTTYLSKTDAGEADLFMYDTSGPPDPQFFLAWFFGETSPKNSWNDTKVQAVLAQAARTVDLEARAKLYRQAQEMLHEGVPAVPIVHNSGVKLVRSSVQDFVADPVHNDNLKVVWIKK